MTSTIRNPVLAGFHPDPSILRVGGDYYLATSTFEWWPGVPIHHSRDLVHWRLLTHALTCPTQLSLRGVPDSGGVWAPSLSYADGCFWLVYSIVRNTGAGRPFKDLHNFLITAPQIEGPWSAPAYLNATGFDASLFHDDDGRKWLVQMQWDFRPDRPRFGGIVLQEFDPAAGRLQGEVRTILKKARLIEGPNLYKRAGRYYLLLAEGGTSWNHGVAMARSLEIAGPYELDPEDSVITSRDNEALALQKVGHGELVETGDGEWFLAHLASRPLGSGENRRCVLGRETCLQRVVWDDEGWLRLAHGGHHGLVEVEGPSGLPAAPWPQPAVRDEFDGPPLDPRWLSLRGPADASWCDLAARPGWLRLQGRESLHSPFEQSLLVRRLEAFQWRAETRLAFCPRRYAQAAGLIVWYDTRTHFYLRLTRGDDGRLLAGVVATDDGAYSESPEASRPVDAGDLDLAAEGCGEELRFHLREDGGDWRQIGGAFDLGKISDDYGSALHFTGGMVGLCAQDLDGTRLAADFDYFTLVHDASGRD